MASLEEGTWHERHVVWHLPPSACVYVTHGTWRMESKCKASERKFPFCGIKPRKRLWEKKNNSVEERKGNEGEKEKKEKKGKEKKEKKRKKGKKMRKNKRQGENRTWMEREKKMTRASILGVPTVKSC